MALWKLGHGLRKPVISLSSFLDFLLVFKVGRRLLAGAGSVNKPGRYEAHPPEAGGTGSTWCSGVVSLFSRSTLMSNNSFAMGEYCYLSVGSCSVGGLKGEVMGVRCVVVKTDVTLLVQWVCTYLIVNLEYWTFRWLLIQSIMIKTIRYAIMELLLNLHFASWISFYYLLWQNSYRSAPTGLKSGQCTVIPG